MSRDRCQHPGCHVPMTRLDSRGRRTCGNHDSDRQRTERFASTVGELRGLIKEARAVYVAARFGVTEKYVRISKSDARFLVHRARSAETAESFEIDSGEFGSLDPDGNLWMG